MDMSIRMANRDDAASITRLSRQLGCSLPSNDLERQLDALLGLSDQLILVAEHNGQVTGYIHGQVTHRLTTSPFLEICGLVVDEGFRRRGMATRLVNTLRKQVDRRYRLRVRHNIQREDAALFYNNLRFVHVKTQHVLEHDNE